MDLFDPRDLEPALQQYESRRQPELSPSSRE